MTAGNNNSMRGKVMLNRFPGRETVVANAGRVEPSGDTAAPGALKEAPMLINPGGFMPPSIINLKAIIPPLVFRLRQNGPVITDNSRPSFNDRYDEKTRWYFPEFTLKEPLLDSFMLTCRQYGIDSNANPAYNGEATFTVTKSMPAAVKELAGNSSGITYKEIPLNGMSMSFVVTLCDNSVLPYTAQLTENDSTFTLAIKLETQESLTRFYKFISNPDNKKFCSISVSGSHFGYFLTAKPLQIDIYREKFYGFHLKSWQENRMIDPTEKQERYQDGNAPARINPPTDNTPVNVDDDYDVKEAIPFLRTIPGVNFDSGIYPLNYLAVSGSDGGISTPFGCKPPFGEDDARSNKYDEFILNKGSLGTRDYGITQIYRNTYNGNFLVIPARYVIAFDMTDDEQLLVPSAYLFTSIDADGVNKSTATFRFNIVPDLSAYELLLIKKLIFDNLPSYSRKTLDDIYVDFPDKVREPEKIVFDARIPSVVISPMGAYQNGITGSRYFHLQFQNVAISGGNAAWVAELLKKPSGGFVGNIMFDLDADSISQSVIDLSLARISGNGLALLENGASGPCLVNRTLYDFTIDSCQTATSDGHLFAPALQLPANGFVGVDASAPPVEIAQAVFNYEVDVVRSADYLDHVLKEIRIVDLDTCISDGVIVTNNTGLFSMYSIASIDIMISIVKPGETDPAKALFTDCKKLIKDGAINNVPFTLPVDQYLSRWSAVYSTVVNFQDGSQQVNPVQIIDDLNKIGKLINLTVSKLNLHK